MFSLKTPTQRAQEEGKHHYPKEGQEGSTTQQLSGAKHHDPEEEAKQHNTTKRGEHRHSHCSSPVISTPYGRFPP